MLDSYLISDAILNDNECLNTFKSKSKILFTNSKKLQISTNTVFILSTFDWLINSSRTNTEYLYILKSYYNKYPNDSNIQYGRGFSYWIENNSDHFRIDYGSSCIPRALIIGYFAKDENELNDLIENNIRVTHNSDEAVWASTMGATFIFLCKTLKTKSEILLHLKDKFNYTPLSSRMKNTSSMVNISDAKFMIFKCLDIVFNSNSYIDAISKALNTNVNCNLTFQTVSILAEALFKVVPDYIKILVRSKISDKEFILHQNAIDYLIANSKKCNIQNFIFT